MKTRSLSLLAAACALAGLVTGCDDGAPADPSTCRPVEEALSAPVIEVDATVPAGCWLVGETLYVSGDAVLSLAPGATLKFALGAGLEVGSDAALSAVGTAEAPILLTGQTAERGAWTGVVFNNSASFQNALVHVTVEFAGGEEQLDDGARPFRAAVMLDSSGFDVRARLSNTTIRQSLGYGLFVDHTAFVPDFTGNRLTENHSGAAYVYAASAHTLSHASTYSGNDADLVYVNVDYDFLSDRTWDALDVPYHVDGWFVLNRHLTVAAGARLLFTEGSTIKIAGDDAGITAVGSAGQPILLSGTAQTPGFWGGLYFENTNDATPATPRSRLSYVVLEYGGAYEFNDGQATPVRGNLMLDSSGYGVAVTLDHATVRHSSGWGVWSACEATLAGGTGNTFSDNAAGDHGFEGNCS